MLFDDDFVVSLSQDDPYDAVLKVVEFYLVANEQGTTIEDALETRDFLVTLSNDYGIDLPDSLNSQGKEHAEWNHIFRYIQSDIKLHILNQRSDDNKKRFASLLGHQFHYSLSDADIERIQILINELRHLITNNTRIDEGHRRRLLLRLERLQTELHKRVSDLDRFWGIVADGGVLMRKLGEDAKPIVDRIREIAEIAWRSQADAEQLPSSAKPALQIEERSGSPDV
jgi:hypothetical protein